MSIILIAASLILVSTLPGKQAGDYNYRSIDTLRKIQKIENATKGFMAAYGRRPCPADGQYAMNTANFGVEAATPGTCTGGTPAAPLGPDAATSNVVAGVVPTKTLNLPDDYAVDGWGRRFTYFVDKRATGTATCSTLEGTAPHIGNGSIAVKDAGGGIKDYAMYAYVSHGPDGYGAWPEQGSALADRINTGSRDTASQDNASVNADFTTNFDNVIVQKEKTSSFDDIVYYADTLKNTCCIGLSCTSHVAQQDGLRIDGKSGVTEMGMSLATGDVNGDGITDLLIGAPGTVDAGTVFVVFGTRAGFPDPLPLSSLDGSNGFVISNSGTNQTDERFGWSLATGDVNGDGVPDIVIGAPMTLAGRLASEGGGNFCIASLLHQPGHMYVVFGHGGHWNATYTLPHAGSDVRGNYDYSKGEGADIYDDYGSSGDSGGDFGWSVATGDFDGDGIADIVVGSLTHTTVVYGGKGTWTKYGVCDGCVALAQTPIYPDPGGSTNAPMGKSGSMEFGYAVATGHIHRSDVSDIIIGVPGANPPVTGGDGGMIYGIFGNKGRPNSSLSVDDTMATAGMGFSLGGDEDVFQAGGSVAAGDVNGDGYDDIVIGSGTPGIQYDTAGAMVSTWQVAYGESFKHGTAYVVFGKASGWSDYMSLADLTGSNGFGIDRTSGYATATVDVDNYFGASVGAADLNNDGYADVIIGAPTESMESITGSGAAYILFGKSTFSLGNYNVVDFDGTNGSRLDAFDTAISAGTGGTYTNAFFGWAIATGDINGDNYRDAILSAPLMNLGGTAYANTGSPASIGSTFVDFGTASGWPSDVDVSAF